MELRHLRYFVVVADELHFGRAAARLHIVQSALSKQIMALERDLGAPLLIRAKSGVSLTPAGESLYRDALRLLRRADRAVESAQLTARGELGALSIGLIGPASWNVLPAILREHRSRHPGVRFDLHELGSDLQLESLRHGTLDVGLLRPPAFDELLQFEPLRRDGFVVALPVGHAHANDVAIDLSELADETFIALPRAAAPRIYDILLTVCHDYGFAPTLLEEANSPIAGMTMASSGLGVALVTESFATVSWPGVVFRPLTRPTPQIDLALGYRRDDRSAALAAFVESARAASPLTARVTA